MTSLTITKITMVTGNHPDTLIMETTLPEGMWPYEGKAIIKLCIAAGKGEEYCKKYFSDVPLEIIHTRKE